MSETWPHLFPTTLYSEKYLLPFMHLKHLLAIDSSPNIIRLELGIIVINVYNIFEINLDFVSMFQYS